MQALVHYTIADFATFRTAFDADAEDRGQNGLSLLQLWRESDASAWALYQVSDAGAARGYLTVGGAAFADQAGVSATDFHFVETA
ncbi:hypothetical protein SAMN04489859_103020 [Paracoccus alcaliphilus]|uniref:Mono-oxygenase ydhR n=1 Tax=Paracoccus alcaliphilus TaxID=34002 RepID=A0A1H8LF26_9RHOB|nr:hypothetical protein [Paracoccus alcaliphilus]WCR18524.1 hypothetical protein JHW40_01805 [Paracoccus alcaliphilus]SEO03725.1 hypothetical protein SAMN04489859_103020 [Paracoccus alcaliphilus]